MTIYISDDRTEDKPATSSFLDLLGKKLYDASMSSALSTYPERDRQLVFEVGVRCMALAIKLKWHYGNSQDWDNRYGRFFRKWVDLFQRIESDIILSIVPSLNTLVAFDPATMRVSICKLSEIDKKIDLYAAEIDALILETARDNYLRSRRNYLLSLIDIRRFFKKGK